MVGLQTLDLAIGVRVPASQLNRRNKLRAALNQGRPFDVIGFSFAFVPQRHNADPMKSLFFRGAGGQK